MLAGLLIFFVMFEAGFYDLTLFFSRATGFGQLAWTHIGIAM